MGLISKYFKNTDNEDIQVFQSSLTAQQREDALIKANSISSSASEIDNGALKDKQNVVSGLYNIGTTIGINKFPKDLVSMELGSLTSVGVFSSSGTTYVSGYFEVKANQIYSFSYAIPVSSVAQYDASFNFISKVSPSLGTTFTSSSTTKYMRIAFYSLENANNTMLNEGSYLGNIPLVPFKLTIQEDYLSRAVLKSDKRTIQKSLSTNILDQSLTGVLGTINQFGTQISSTTQMITDYQPFPYSGKTISTGVLAVPMKLIEYDSDKKYIQYRDFYNASIIVHSDTAYVRWVTYAVNSIQDLSSYVVVLGSIKPTELYSSKYAIAGSNIENRVYMEQELSIPSTIYTLQNKQTNIYHNHLLKEPSRKDSSIEISNFILNKEYSRVTKTTSGTTSCEAILYDRDFVPQSRKTISLITGSSTLSTGNIVLGALGDSYTQPATHIKKLSLLIPNFMSTGTMDGHPTLAAGFLSEGRNGWTLKNYFETINASSGSSVFSPFMQPSGVYKYYGSTNAIISTLAAGQANMYSKLVEIGFNATTGLKNNPVVNDCMYVFADSAYKYWNGTTWTVITEATLGFTFNFAKYRSVWNIAQPTHFLIELGINDFATLYHTEVKIKWDLYFKSYLDQVIASVKADNPTCKIGVCIPNNKFSDNNVSSGINFISKKDRAMFEARKLFISNYDNRTAENIYLLDSCASIDTTYGMGYLVANAPFEEYIETTSTVNLLSDPIHPNVSGSNARAIPIAGWIQSTR